METVSAIVKLIDIKPFSLSRQQKYFRASSLFFLIFASAYCTRLSIHVLMLSSWSDYITVDELGLVMRSGIDLTDFLTLKRKVQGRITMLFNALDQDDNGYISDDDLRLIINTVKHEHTPKEVEAMVRKADKDGDGKITSYELINVFFVPRDTPSYTYNPPPRPKYHSPPKYTSSVSLGADYSTLQDQQVEPSVIVVGATAP